MGSERTHNRKAQRWACCVREDSRADENGRKRGSEPLPPLANVVVFVYVLSPTSRARFPPQLSPASRARNPPMSTIAQEYTVWPANGTDPEEERFVDPTRHWEAIPGPELTHPPPDGQVRHQRMCNCNFVRPGEERPHQASTSNGKPHGASTSNPNPTHATKPSKLSLRYWKNRWCEYPFQLFTSSCRTSLIANEPNRGHSKEG